MKRYVGVGFGVVALVGALAVQSASAVTITRIPGYHSGSAGEFTVFGMGYEQYYAPKATYTDSRGTGFQTFCLEMNESVVSLPSDYEIDLCAIKGGYGGGSPDYISIGTAWLYAEFSDGALVGYDYTRPPSGARNVSAAELQYAFWWLEDELQDTDPNGVRYYDPSGNGFLAQALTDLGMNELADLKADSRGAHHVAVINFTKVNRQTGEIEDRQSMLVRVPDGGFTLALLGMGVLGCAALRRRLAR